MNKVLIFAPNCGISFSSGGGSSFTVKLANILSTFDDNVTIAAYHVWSRSKLEDYHGKINAKIIGSEDSLQMVYKIPFKLSAYSGLLHPGYEKFISETLKEDYDVVWFQDDIPKIAEPFLSKFKNYLYVHYPFRGRNKPFDKTLMENINEKILLKLANSLLVRYPQDYCNRIFCNSLVTHLALLELGIQSEILYPPVDVPATMTLSTKSNVILSLGNIQFQKRQYDIVDAFNHSFSKQKQWELHLVGMIRDRPYFEKINRIANGQTFIHGVLSRSSLESLFEKASLIVQAGFIEPFGIALVEAMGWGCFPLVRRDFRSGAWLDVSERGRYGYTFETTDELTELFNNICRDSITIFERQRIIERASYFSKGRFLEVVPRC